MMTSSKFDKNRLIVDFMFFKIYLTNEKNVTNVAYNCAVPFKTNLTLDSLSLR